MATGAAPAPAVATATEAKRAPIQPADEDDACWRRALPLPCQLTVEVPLCAIRVRDFLDLRPGAVLSSNWRITRDAPLRANGTLISWGELEPSSNHVALRLTELG